MEYKLTQNIFLIFKNVFALNKMLAANKIFPS